MREIKFRQAIINRKGEFIGWHYWGFITNGHFASPETGSVSIEIARERSQEYTGLKDKNSKEIYEGDIIQCSMSFEGGTLPHMGEIVYDETFGSFGTKNKAGVTLLCNHCLHTIEVIGNIYENPELLEGL